MGVVLDNVNFFIANVEAGVEFSLAFWKTNILVFLGFAFSLQEDKVFKQS